MRYSSAMDATAPLLSPASDDRFWDRLRTRVDTILEDRRLVAPPAATVSRFCCPPFVCWFFFLRGELDLDVARSLQCGVESERGKRLREDSLMLVHGLDSVAASLAQLSDTLTAAQKVRDPRRRRRLLLLHCNSMLL